MLGTLAEISGAQGSDFIHIAFKFFMIRYGSVRVFIVNRIGHGLYLN